MSYTLPMFPSCRPQIVKMPYSGSDYFLHLDPIQEQPHYTDNGVLHCHSVTLKLVLERGLKKAIVRVLHCT